MYTMIKAKSTGDGFCDWYNSLGKIERDSIRHDKSMLQAAYDAGGEDARTAYRLAILKIIEELKKARME